jgi:DNA-binding NtrC family response regulator
MPALRERREDILTLAEYFLSEACKRTNKGGLKFSPEAKDLLLNYDYPGNVRELENIVHRSAILCKAKTIKPEHLPEEIIPGTSAVKTGTAFQSLPFREAKEKVISDFERQYLQQVLKECNGVISKAAEHMGMHKKNLHEKLNKYGIRPDK